MIDYLCTLKELESSQLLQIIDTFHQKHARYVCTFICYHQFAKIPSFFTRNVLISSRVFVYTPNKAIECTTAVGNLLLCCIIWRNLYRLGLRLQTVTQQLITVPQYTSMEFVSFLQTMPGQKKKTLLHFIRVCVGCV